MKKLQHFTIVLTFLAVMCGVCATLSAKQGTRDSTFFNSNSAGIPNSGNTLNPNNGPEFPHSSPGNPTTDPGPITPGGPNVNMADTTPHFRLEWHRQ